MTLNSFAVTNKLRGKTILPSLLRIFDMLQRCQVSLQVFLNCLMANLINLLLNLGRYTSAGFLGFHVYFLATADAVLCIYYALWFTKKLAF